MESHNVCIGVTNHLTIPYPYTFYSKGFGNLKTCKTQQNHVGAHLLLLLIEIKANTQSQSNTAKSCTPTSSNIIIRLHSLLGEHMIRPHKKDWTNTKSLWNTANSCKSTIYIYRMSTKSVHVQRENCNLYLGTERRMYKATFEWLR